MVKKLNLNVIRIDGGTQPRLEISNEVVGDYAEAVKDGIEFPAVVVFHDGADYWLADGFHRYHSHKQAGKASIEAEVHSGTVRDAILYSVGANGTHGLRRTNADKRKAVETLLADAEWAEWSDRKIAEACGVTHPFVSAVRAPKVVTVTTRATKKEAPEQDAGVVTVTTPAPKPAAKTAPWDTPAATAAPADDGPTAAELAAAEREAAEEIEALRKVALADDKVAAALAEAKQLRALNRVLQERNDGLMNEKNELVKRIRALQRKLDRLEQPA